MAKEAIGKFQINSTAITVDNVLYHVVVVDGNGSGAVAKPTPVIVIEPITWGWLALKLCEGVISYIGGKLFAQFIGDTSLTKRDLKDLLTEFISVIAALLRTQLELNDKRQIEASSASLQSLFELYLTNRDTSYLTPLVFKADDLYHQAASLPLIMTPCFGIVGTLELAILQEAYLVKKTRDNKRAISVKAQGLVKESGVFRPALEAYNTARFSPAKPLSTWVWPGVTGDAFWGYTLDGKVFGVGQAWFQKDAESHRQMHMAQEFALLEKTILGPLYAVVDKWKAIAAKNKDTADTLEAESP
jgi:hypothetical protein